MSQEAALNAICYTRKPEDSQQKSKVKFHQSNTTIQSHVEVKRQIPVSQFQNAFVQSSKEEFSVVESETST